MLVSKVVGCKRTEAENDTLQVLARPYLLPIYPKRDNATRIHTLGGNRLFAWDFELATGPSKLTGDVTLPIQMGFKKIDPPWSPRV